MTKSERLADLLGLPVEMVEREIDEGMWDILIELNRKGYYTIFCCEGHCNSNSDKRGKVGHWEGYLAFAKTHNFIEYPPKFSKVTNKRRFFYWSGYGEESREKFLENVLRWARCLPTKEKEKIVMYHLTGRNKKQPNREPKLFAYTDDYEEIRCILNRADLDNYFDFKLYEDIKYI